MNKILISFSKVSEKEGITITELERKIGASKGVLSRALKNNTDIQAKWVQSLVENYPQYNIEWILTGKGPMLKSDTENQEIQNDERKASSTEQKKIDSSLVLDRIKRYFNFKTDTELASYLGINLSTLSGWRRERGIANWELIFEKCKGMSLDWLINGASSQNANKNFQESTPSQEKDRIIKEKDERINELQKDKERLWRIIEAGEVKKQIKGSKAG